VAGPPDAGLVSECHPADADVMRVQTPDLVVPDPCRT